MTPLSGTNLCRTDDCTTHPVLAMTASAYPSRRGSVSFQHTVSARRTALSIGTSTQKRRNPVQYSTTFGQNLASCIGGPVWTPWNSLPTLLHPLKATAVTPTIPTSPGVYFVRWGSSLHIPNLYAGMSVVPVAPAAIKSAINPKLFILCSNNADISLLYIGKAMNLRKRIRQFYRSSLYYASIAAGSGGVLYTSAGNHRGGKLIWFLERPQGRLAFDVLAGNSNVEIRWFDTQTLLSSWMALTGFSSANSTMSSRQLESMLIVAATCSIGSSSEIMPLANQVF